ncbi:YncE family protein [Acidicapsa ligni]|uniref:YncE family protein n=1 Tax=Acidicapsa ligni TaxID=542300 RepID=UPI0021E0E36A|nr:YncE family protein [Acidicapsa ligni]
MNSRSKTDRLCYSILAALILFSLTAAKPVSAQKAFKVLDKWTVGGEGGWDYLVADSAAHRLYITHGTRVEVIDSSTGKSIGAITGLHGTHGVALDDSGNFGYISDGGGNAVVVFDRTSLATVATIPAGTNPDGIVFEPVTKTVWAFNGRSKDATVIDTATRKVIATVPLPGKPEFPVADGTGIVFDNIEDKNAIVRLDAKSPKITATWPLANCDSPSGLAIDLSGRRLFSVCDGKKMAITDANTGKQLAAPSIGDGPDAAGYNPKSKLAFSSNGEGTLTIIDASNSNYRVLQNLTTQARARTMTIDTATGKVYVVTAQTGPAPAATAANPHPRPAVIPGTFTVLVIGHE